MDKEVILDYEDFEVIYDYNTHKYIYIDSEDTFEVFPIATLQYDCIHEPEANGEILSMLFDCTCCGEYVGDEDIKYIWFSTERQDKKDD